VRPTSLLRRTREYLDADSLPEVASQAILQQVMNHRDAGIFQAYLNERVRCDVQAAFLGRPSADALIKATSHMSRFVDPRAPVGLTETQTSSLKTHPQLIQHRALRDSLSKTLRDTYGTIKKAKGTQLHDLYRKADLQFQNAKARLRASAKKEARQQFFDNIDTQEVNEQLDPSILGLEHKDWIPEMVKHEMAERKHLAEMLCDRTTGLTDEAALDRRICTIQALVAFCKVQGARQRRRSPPSRDWGLTRDCEPSEAEVPKPRPIPQSCLNTQCIFCLGNLELPAESRFFCFLSTA
jgi:hypothetical protein